MAKRVEAVMRPMRELLDEKDFHYSKLSLEAIGLVTQVARKCIGIFKG